jgi:Transcriptional regulator PadR-like family
MRRSLVGSTRSLVAANCPSFSNGRLFEWFWASERRRCVWRIVRAMSGLDRGALSDEGSARRQAPSPLRGTLLGLLVSEEGQPLSAYRLATLVERRLGPAWRVTRQSVYGALKRLEQDGLVSARGSRAGAAHDGDGQIRYSATRSTLAAHDAWIASPAVKEPVRAELQARIAMSEPRHVPQLLAALDAYERACFEMLRETGEAEVPMGSWTGLVMNLGRIAADESLQAELRWVALAREWIEEYAAEASSDRA